MGVYTHVFHPRAPLWFVCGLPCSQSGRPRSFFPAVGGVAHGVVIEVPECNAPPPPPPIQLETRAMYLLPALLVSGRRLLKELAIKASEILRNERAVLHEVLDNNRCLLEFMNLMDSHKEKVA